MSHWRTSRATLAGGDRSPGSHSAHDTQRGPYSLPRSPSEMILHPQNISHPPFEIAARFCFSLFVVGLIAFFIAVYYGAVFVFGV